MKVWEKHIVKDFNYHMILQRNQATSTLSQSSVLKALLKWRDYIARVEDESPSYIMPNHVLFTFGSNMPVSRNEFRDCCRSNFNSMMLKYQDDISRIQGSEAARILSEVQAALVQGELSRA